MKKMLPILILTVFFLVEYESYTWNPCDGNTCLAIYCGEDGVCDEASRHFFVKTIEEVRELVRRNGTEHLYGMYRIEYENPNIAPQIIELELVPDFKIEDKERKDGLMIHRKTP